MERQLIQTLDNLKAVLAAGGLGFMLTAMLLAPLPARAQRVDDKIKALEQELSALKSQQMQFKKEATAAAAALPSFSYRPGNGVNIEAADKSWGITFSMEAHIRALFGRGRIKLAGPTVRLCCGDGGPICFTASTTVCMRSRWVLI